MAKSVRYGHSKCPPSADNLPRQQRKISKGFRNDGSNEMSPSNIGVGGMFTDDSADTFRVEEVSIQYQTATDKQGKPAGPVTEESVVYLRPTHVDAPEVVVDLGDDRRRNLPRSYTKKVNGEIVESLTNF
jgi:hypothetical protein